MSEIASEPVKVIWNAVRSVIYDRVSSYLSFIQNYEQNLKSLCDELDNLWVKKKDVDAKVLSGNDKFEKPTFKATHWLAQVQALTPLSNDKEMKKLMIKDMGIAKAMLRLMKNADLKKLVEEDREMRALVVKVMKDIAEKPRPAEEKDEEVGLVLEKLMVQTIDAFKILMQNKYVAIAALHLLENHKEILERLVEKDKEVADIIAKARMMSLEEEFPNPDSDDNVLVCEKNLRDKVATFLNPVKGVILDEELLKALPENVGLGMKAMGIVIGNRRELKAQFKGVDKTASHRNCCAISYSYLSDRHDTSKAATDMLAEIKRIGDPPQDLTLPRGRDEMRDIPPDVASLESRNQIRLKIVEALASNDVQTVGIFGMFGSGKTTLAKEIVNSKANGLFQMLPIMVEITESPNIESIQDQIANSLGLDNWHNVHGISEKATRLYNKFKPEEKSKEKEKKEKDDNNNSRKTLIVLDNIWKEIELHKIGIPREYCKLLLTSRTKDVFERMGVLKDNIYELLYLDKVEAKILFEFQFKKKVNEEYNSVADNLLEKCGGLPLAIVATANSLKGKELPLWRQFAERLEKPISCQITGAHYETFLILKTSYEVMESDEKKKFFLLACLSSIGSSISIDNLMRYGIGLGLFQHVNKLSEAIEVARTWAEELVSSSMLRKGDSDEYVKIHDVVRESIMSFVSRSGINTDGQLFLVDAIPRWILEETFNKYTGISLLAQSNFARLSGVKADLLEILLFKGNEDHSSSLKSNFFQGMANLKVLEVSFMNFEEGLPKSMGELKVLKTLHLAECKLREMKLIGELGSLLVLSLKGSSLDKLPDEIGKLHQLRLFDLSKCRCKEPRIPANVLAKLSLLEGLYLGDTQWAVTESTSNDTGVTNAANKDVFNNLEFLNVLEIQMLEPKSIPIGAKFVENLDKFKLIIGKDDFEFQPSQRALVISEFDVSQELKKDNCLKALLKKADFLALKSATVNNIVPELDKQGFRGLGRLELSNIDSISKICEGKAPKELFSNLSHLEVSSLEKLQVLLPVNHLPRNMTTLSISECNSLDYIFSDDNVVNKESDIIELPCLKTLELYKVANLISVVKESNNDDGRRPSFFNRKVKLTSLEELSLYNNKMIVKLGDKESNQLSFQNLKVLDINGCEEMETVGPPSMFRSLVQLERLTIEKCNKMQQVISDESEEGDIPKVTLLNLKRLEIQNMENLECFYGGSCKMAFPCLTDLTLDSLKRMTRFAGGRNSTAFFSKTIEFLCLEELWLDEVSDEMRVLWEFNEGEGQGISSNLKTLHVGKMKLPSIVFKSLSELTLDPVGDAKFLFSASENKGCVGAFFQFPKLEDLTIQGYPNSVQQFIEDGGSAMSNFCKKLTCLTLDSALSIEMTALHPFKSLRDLSISGLPWEYVFSVGCVFEQLQSLEKLDIDTCPNLEVIIRGDKDTPLVFPRLKYLTLGSLERMSKLCSNSDIPFHFPSLVSIWIYSCNKLESLFCGEQHEDVELPALEYISIGECNAMKFFSTKPLKAPNLRVLYVSLCPEVEWFLLGNSNCNTDVKLSSLEHLSIWKCPNMKSFSPALLRAPRLRKLSVVECKKWEWLFNGEPNQVVELLSLERVTIEECDAIKSFSTTPLKAPKLRQLNVSKCPAMEWFLLGNSNCNADLELPSLEKVIIDKCPKMKSFSPALLRAPKLQLVEVDDKPYPIDDIQDFNHIFQSANSSDQTAADKTDL